MQASVSWNANEIRRLRSLRGSGYLAVVWLSRPANEKSSCRAEAAFQDAPVRLQKIHIFGRIDQSGSSYRGEHRDVIQESWGSRFWRETVERNQTRISQRFWATLPIILMYYSKVGVPSGSPRAKCNGSGEICE